MLSVNDVEVELGQMLGIIDQHMICSDKVVHPLYKAVVERLQKQIINIAYVLAHVVFEVVFLNTC